MLKLIFLILLFFIARFIWRYILPIVRLMRNAHRKMNEMNQQMNNSNRNNHSPSQSKSSLRNDQGEYIDYEEVK